MNPRNPKDLLAPQQSTTARITPGCPKCGLDRRIRAENRSSPQRCTPSGTPQPWPHRESAAHQPSASTTKTSRRRTGCATVQPHGPNRESHDDIGTSPHRDRNALGHQPRHHRRTAEFRQSTHTITISRRLADHPDHPSRGPNREMQATDQSSPQRHPPSNHPCNHGYTANRSTSTIRRHHKDQQPGHRPRNRPAPRTESEIARRHRNQSTPASGHTRSLKLFTPIKSASASAVISPLLPTLRHPSASVEGFGIHDTGFPRSDNT